jgi:hypothetical protein
MGGGFPPASCYGNGKYCQKSAGNPALENHCCTKKAATSPQGIIAAFAKWIAADNPFDCEPAAFQGTVFFYRLQRIFTAGRCKPAAGRL